MVEVGGVGLLVRVSATTAATLPAVGAETSLLTVLAVREESLDLYGFASAGERALFEAFTGVSGVGPRLALAICGLDEPGELRLALARGDSARLQAASGVGKRTAERIVLELRDRLGSLNGGGAARRDRRVGRRLPVGARRAGRARLPSRGGRRRARRRARAASTPRAWCATASAALSAGERGAPRRRRRARRGGRARRLPAPPPAGRLHRPGGGQAAAGDLPRGGAPARGGPRPRAARRARRASARPRWPGSWPSSWGWASTSRAGRCSSARATWPRSSPPSSPTTCSSSTRSTGSTGPSRRSSTRRWRTSSSTWSSARGPRRGRCGSTCRASR